MSTQNVLLRPEDPDIPTGPARFSSPVWLSVFQHRAIQMHSLRAGGEGASTHLLFKASHSTDAAVCRKEPIVPP